MANEADHPDEQSSKDSLHVVPIDDLREHVISSTCWCRPKQDDETPRLWTHNSMDRREEYETGERKSS
jgi:hypothetical protein